MTDKLKDEFINNSHWLKLSFHAYSEFPDMPYKNTAPEVILEHAVKANREIVRFAGKETLSDAIREKPISERARFMKKQDKYSFKIEK